MTTFVLDASALLALIQDERGAERVLRALEQGACLVSAVNLSEALAKLIVSGVPCDRAEAIHLGLPAQVVPCEARIALEAARLASLGKPLGLSLGDRICIATALVHGGTVLSTDQAWRQVQVAGLTVEVVREPWPAADAAAIRRPAPKRKPLRRS